MSSTSLEPAVLVTREAYAALWHVKTLVDSAANTVREAERETVGPAIGHEQETNPFPALQPATEALMKVRGRRFREVPIGGAKDSNSDAIPSELEDWGPNPEQRYSQEELCRILETAISELDAGYRIVFQLRDVEGLSTEETARTLNLSLPAVKTRLRRARLQLRNSLDIYFRRPKSRDGKTKNLVFESNARPGR